MCYYLILVHYNQLIYPSPCKIDYFIEFHSNGCLLLFLKGPLVLCEKHIKTCVAKSLLPNGNINSRFMFSNIKHSIVQISSCAYLK